mmetsp:Transcript_25294/g.47042  ORF Transcript_25294/g.47042 Transcript_25294/m.47042 type:complete len:202 (-) Transcript_25294:161-766(-)
MQKHAKSVRFLAAPRNAYVVSPHRARDDCVADNPNRVGRKAHTYHGHFRTRISQNIPLSFLSHSLSLTTLCESFVRYVSLAFAKETYHFHSLSFVASFLSRHVPPLIVLSLPLLSLRASSRSAPPTHRLQWRRSARDRGRCRRERRPSSSSATSSPAGPAPPRRTPPAIPPSTRNPDRDSRLRSGWDRRTVPFGSTTDGRR